MDPEIFSPFGGLWTSSGHPYLSVSLLFQAVSRQIHPLKAAIFGLLHLGFTNASNFLHSQPCPSLNSPDHTSGFHPEMETSCKTKLSASPCGSLNCSRSEGLKNVFQASVKQVSSSLHSDLHCIQSKAASN